VSARAATARPASRVGTARARRLPRLLGGTFLVVVAAASFFPFFTMLVSSTHDNYAIISRVTVLPGDSFLVNYHRLTQNLDIWRGFANSLIIALSSTVIGVYVTALTAYGFAKFSFKGRGILFSVVIFAIMIPGQIGTVGFFRQMTDMHLLNTWWPLILPSMASCFGVFFFRQYIDSTVPDETIEASFMDGCRETLIFHRIVLPLITPALAIQAIMSFIGHWNSYLMPLILLREGKKLTLPVLIATVRSAYGTDFGAQYVGILISVVPLVVLFSVASKFMMDRISVSMSVTG
jgi:multiple sugar transport system permease protein